MPSQANTKFLLCELGHQIFVAARWTATRTSFCSFPVASTLVVVTYRERERARERLLLPVVEAAVRAKPSTAACQALRGQPQRLWAQRERHAEARRVRDAAVVVVDGVALVVVSAAIVVAVASSRVRRVGAIVVVAAERRIIIEVISERVFRGVGGGGGGGVLRDETAARIDRLALYLRGAAR